MTQRNLLVRQRERHIVYNDIPNVDALAMMYPDFHRARPVPVYEKNQKT